MAIYLGDSPKLKFQEKGISVNMHLPKINIPTCYQEVEYIRADRGVQAYIDLGFAFDTSAIIYIEQFLDSDPQWLTNMEETYIFGAADNSGVYRCMLTSPGNQYGSFIYATDNVTYRSIYGKAFYKGRNSIKIVQKPGNMYFYNIDTREQMLNATYTSTNVAHTMTDNLYLLGQNYKGAVRYGGSQSLSRCIGRFSYYNNNDELICDLYPCYSRSTGEVGMYDRIRKIFLTSSGPDKFTKGPNRTYYPFTNIAKPDSAGWKDGYRLSTANGTGLVEYEGVTASNSFEVKAGDIIRITGANFIESDNGCRVGLIVQGPSSSHCQTSLENFLMSVNGVAIMKYLGLKNGIYTFKIPEAEELEGYYPTFMRFSFETPTNAKDVLITINEKII